MAVAIAMAAAAAVHASAAVWLEPSYRSHETNCATLHRRYSAYISATEMTNAVYISREEVRTRKERHRDAVLQGRGMIQTGYGRLDGGYARSSDMGSDQ